MTHHSFPSRIETDRLVFERLSRDATDVVEFYEFVSDPDWQGDATDPMPWFRFQSIDDVSGFVDHAETQWQECESARYLLYAKNGAESNDGTDPELVGTAAYSPDWDKRSAGSDVVLAKRYWGNGYGTERGRVFVELAFQHHDLDAYVTSCADGNDPSRRMIEKLVETYGGRYDGLMRQHGSPRPDGTVTDQHRYSIVREEYEGATEAGAMVECDMEW